MKNLILGLLLFVGFIGWGQKDERIIHDSTTQYDKADNVYGNLKKLIPTQKLYNRLLYEDPNQSIAWNTDSLIKNEKFGATADHAYGLLYELQLMSFDTSSVSNRIDVFNSVSMYVGENEFEEEEYYYPIGIFDYEYNNLDEELNIHKGNIILEDSSYYSRTENLILEKRQASMIAPLYDLHDSPRMAIVFKKEYFFSNYRKVDEIESIVLVYKGKRYPLNFDEIFYFTADRAIDQTFQVKIIYKDKKVLSNSMIIHTPEIDEKHEEKGILTFKRCALNGEFSEPRGEKLKWCMIESCGNNSTYPRIFKPYILITGYRPPIVGQTFRKTWKIYNSEHKELLNQLRDNGYDVFIVRFNMAAKPNKLGILEASKLLEKFIIWVNEQKGGQSSGQENIIQGSSMGETVARLTLLRMEKKHFENSNSPNHHTRLNIAYDGNIYGGNIPLSYQAQIYSAMNYPRPGLGMFVTMFLHASMQQKATKELLTYHIQYPFENIFTYRSENMTYTPSHHPRRQGVLDQLNSVNNNYVSTSAVPYTNFVPMPNAPRNIAISLGHFNMSNDSHRNSFFSPGEYWRDINVWGAWQFKLGVAKYTSSNNSFLLYKRKIFSLNPFNSFNAVDHELRVKNMLEVDNASGSYIGGAGNIVNVADHVYFPLAAGVQNKRNSTHKSVLTALAINQNLWPANGSLTMDMQGMGLMNIGRTSQGGLIPSNYFGYPNLGRPNDHFEVTPFEAIFVSKEVQRHIRLSQDLPEDIEALNNFILNEVEPWYLGLQNMRIGSQARSDYRYHSYRRALHRIVVGDSVTPTTDYGEYTVEANGKLTLKAGDVIKIDKAHFKSGSIIHIVPGYNRCSNAGNKSMVNDDDTNENMQSHEEMIVEKISNSKIEFNLYPNPVSEVLTIESNSQTKMDKVSIYNLNGVLRFYKETNQSMLRIQTNNLDKGIYFVKINAQGEVFTYKLVVI